MGRVMTAKSFEAVRAVMEEKGNMDAEKQAVGIEIKIMDLDSFSESSADVEKLRELLREF